MHTAESFVTLSATAIRFGTGPNGSLANVVSSPAINTRLPSATNSNASGHNPRIEELHLIDPHHIHRIQPRIQLLAQQLHSRHGHRLMRLRAVRCNRRAVIPQVDVRLIASHPLPCNPRPLQPPDQLSDLPENIGPVITSSTPGTVIDCIEALSYFARGGGINVQRNLPVRGLLRRASYA